MQQILDQEEDRNYRLDRYLEARSETAGGAENHGKTLQEIKDEYENIDDIGDEGNEEDDEDEEEEESDDATEEAQIEKLPDLESAVAILTKGPSFKAFKSSLHSFVNPPMTIGEALSCQNIKMLRQLLKKRFEIVAQGEYFWIRELDEIGYTHDEIADLLFEQASEVPFTYLEPNTLDKFSRELYSISHRSLKRTSGISDKETDLLQSVISELRSADPASIAVLDLQASCTDKWQCRIEELSGISWNWWPLQDPIYPLLPGQIYLL